MKKRHVRKVDRPGLAHSPGMKVLCGLVIVTVLLGAVFWTTRLALSWLKSTPFLALRHIEIECNDDSIKEWTFNRVQALFGKNLLVIDKAQVKNNLLKNPWIRGVELDLKPPHGLNIEIKTRRAVAFVRKGEDIILVDSSGELFLPSQENLTKDRLFELRGELDRAFQAKFRKFIGLLDRYGKILCHQNIASVTFDKETMTVVTKSNTIPLVFKLSMPLDTQMKRAEAILYHLYSSGKYRYVKRVDLWIGDDKAIASFKKKV